MHTKTLVELRQLLDQKIISSRELTQYFLNRIKTHNARLNCFVTVCEEQALQQAQAADVCIQKGHASALTGIPLAHKDIFCTAGIKTSCGSKMLDRFIAPYDATMVAKLKQAGMVTLGKTNMDEFAMGSSNETSFYGPVHNPWDLTCIPGGSSGGSAAAVAARLAPMATGTDTGGSIRQPAALCGITGLKPTYGRISRYGMIAFASSLDCAGPLAQTAEDLAWVLGSMAGFDERDSTSSPGAVADYTATLKDSIQGLRIGLPEEYFSEQLDPKVHALLQAVIKEYERLGVVFKTIRLPHTHLSAPAYYVIAPAEASSNLARYDGVRYGHRCENPKDLQDLYLRSRAEGFGAEVKRRILIGTYVLSSGFFDAYYLKAQKIRRLIKNDFDAAFREVDFILTPTAPSPAFKRGERTQDPIAMYLSDVFTIAVNLAGLPALSMPAGFLGGLPVGVQLIGNYFDEARLLQTAHHYQQVTTWHQQQPSTI